MNILRSPLAIGIYTTFCLVGLVYWYYDKAETFDSYEKKQHSLFYILDAAHQKSIDLRLLLRGELPPQSNIAILSVDGQALREGGRWPWPRSQLAKALTQALDLGTRLIAFDVVFSEPTANVAEDLANRLKSELDLPKNVEAKMDSELLTLNMDAIFSDFVAKYKDRLVLGALYEEEASLRLSDSVTSLCYSLLFERTPAATPWQNDSTIQVDPLLFAQGDFRFPQTLVEAYRVKLGEIENQIVQNRPEARTKRDEVVLQTEIENEQRAFCESLMNPEEDPFFKLFDTETWGQVKAAEPTLVNYTTFADFVAAVKKNNLYQSIPAGWSWVVNIPEINRAAMHTGYFNADQDSDGSIRRLRLLSRAGFHYIPSMALKTYLTFRNLSVQVEMNRNRRRTNRAQIQSFKVVKTQKDGPQVIDHIPVDRDGRIVINYRGREKMFPYVSIANFLNDDTDLEFEQRVFDPQSQSFRVLRQRVPKKDFLKDKILILGATATGVYDLRVTPFQENYPGVETHATVLDNLFSNQFLKASNDENFYMPLACLLLGLLLSVTLSYLPALPGLLTTLLTIFLIFFFDKHFLFQKGILVVILFPLLLTLTLYVTMTFYKYLTEERSKRELRSVFQKYVSPAIVEEVLSHPDRIELGGRKMPVTVFFSDVRGFTTISEKLDPKALSDLLNEYLTPMTDLVFKNRGTLDKYMGDAIMAFFGAPISFQDHAKWACRCALEHVQKLDVLKKEFRDRNLPEIEIGIGLNTGEVSVGNMGSRSVRNYTVMGDQVNLGSRLESATKQYGVRILISQSTYEMAKDAFLCREVDWVRVKGKNQPIRIYELLAEGFQDADHKRRSEMFQQGYDLYRQRDFSQALIAFQAAVANYPTDGVAKLYVERTLHFIESPPSPEWDGVYTMTTK